MNKEHIPELSKTEKMQKRHKCQTKTNNAKPKYNNNKILLILCIILTTNVAEGKKDTTSIKTNKENKNNLIIKANHNPAQATKIEKFPRNKEIGVSNPKIMVTNAIDLKEQWYQLKKIKEEKINIFPNYYSRPFWPLKYE